MDEVARKRHRRSRRSRYWVAAAAALIVGGPVAAFAVTAGDDRGGGSVAVGEPHPTSPAEDSFFEHMTEKVSATDPTTRVGATVGMEEKAWGTHTVLELKNVKGPQKCTLVAVSKTGEEEIVTSWSVPQWGYGIEGATNPAAKAPLYVHGGAAMDREDIARFECGPSTGSGWWRSEPDQGATRDRLLVGRCARAPFAIGLTAAQCR